MVRWKNEISITRTGTLLNLQYVWIPNHNKQRAVGGPQYGALSFPWNTNQICVRTSFMQLISICR